MEIAAIQTDRSSFSPCMKNFFVWLGIFTKVGVDYYPRHRYNLRTYCSDRTIITYGCHTNRSVKIKSLCGKFEIFLFDKISTRNLAHIMIIKLATRLCALTSSNTFFLYDYLTERKKDKELIANYLKIFLDSNSEFIYKPTRPDFNKNQTTLYREKYAKPF